VHRGEENDRTRDYDPQDGQVRPSIANRQAGYISGETLRNVNNPEEYVVISTWRSLEDWQRWFANEKRAELEGKVDALIGSPTIYKIYSYY
jgi:heme-degrading monooxygenase HmoA